MSFFAAGTNSGAGDALGERIEKIGGFGEGGVGGAEGFATSGFEGVFGGDAGEPALVGELFVIGEIEADEEADAVVRGGGFFFVRGFFLYGGGFGFGGVAVGGFFGGDAFEFEEDFVAEAEGLFQRFDFVARLLSGRFVGAEIEKQERVGHEDCISGRGCACQERRHR